MPVYYVVAPAEASSNLARYDGVRYGHRAENPKNLEDLYARSRAEGFGAEVQRRIMIGTYVLSHGYFDAYYLQAQRVRAKIAADFDAAFKQVDFLLSPSTTDVAFPFGENSEDPVQMYLNDIFTIAANLAGLPAMSLPGGVCGRLRAAGRLPADGAGAVGRPPAGPGPCLPAGGRISTRSGRRDTPDRA